MQRALLPLCLSLHVHPEQPKSRFVQRERMDVSRSAQDATAALTDQRPTSTTSCMLSRLLRHHPPRDPHASWRSIYPQILNLLLMGYTWLGNPCILDFYCRWEIRQILSHRMSATKFSDYSQKIGNSLSGVSPFPSFHHWVAKNGTPSPMKTGSCSRAVTRHVDLFFPWSLSWTHCKMLHLLPVYRQGHWG